MQLKNNPSFSLASQEWKLHPLAQDVYFHPKLKIQVQKYFTVPHPEEKELLQRRIKDNYSHVVRVFHLQTIILSETNWMRKQGINVYVERLFKVNQNDWENINTTLSTLKGFRRLSGIYGFFKVTPQMIKINAQKEIKVWVHQNPLASSPQHELNSQAKMVRTVLQIISKNNLEIAQRIGKATSFNEAINNILVSMSKKNTTFTKRDKFQRKSQIVNLNNQYRPEPKKNIHPRRQKINFQKVFCQNELSSQKNFARQKQNKFNIPLKKTLNQTKIIPQFQKGSLNPFLNEVESKKMESTSFIEDEINSFYFSESITKSTKLHKRHSSSSLNKGRSKQLYYQNEEQENLRFTEIARIKENEEESDDQCMEIVPNIVIKEVTRIKSQIPLDYIVEKVEEEEMTETKLMTSTQNSIIEEKQHEEKVMEKQTFTKQLKMELREILGFNREIQSLKIRQKLQQKQQTFAQLKQEALKLLN